MNNVINLDFLKKRPLSFSSLSEFRKSPRHYIHYLTKEWQPPTDAQKVGKLAEHFLFHDDLETFHVMPKIDRRSNAGKELFQQHINEAVGKTMVEQYQVDKAREMVRVALKDPLIMELVENRTQEQKKLTWSEKVEFSGKEYRIPMVGYVDFESVISDGQFICEIKTDRNGNPDDFVRSAVRMLYYLQGGVYSLGYKASFRFPRFRWIVMDSAEPYGAFVMEMSSTDLDRAKDEIKGLLVKFIQCMEDNRWDEDYRFWLRDDSKTFSFFLPKWAYNPVMFFDEDEIND